MLDLLDISGHTIKLFGDMDWIWEIKECERQTVSGKSEYAQKILNCVFCYIFHLNYPKNMAFQLATPCASAKQENATDSEEVKHYCLN